MIAVIVITLIALFHGPIVTDHVELNTFAPIHIVHLADLVMAAEAMKSAMEVFEPALTERREKRQVLGVVVIGTVEGDIHEIGKSLVATMFSAAGFQVHDLGVDVPEKIRLVTGDPDSEAYAAQIREILLRG